MRIEVSLSIAPESRLSVNYQHYLTALVYGLISRGAPKFAAALHDGSSWKKENRPFKYFTFGQLYGGPGTTEFSDGELTFHTDTVTWIFDAALPEISTLVADGLGETGKIRIGPMEASVRSIRSETEPDFSGGRIKGVCLSPLVASLYDDRLGHRYLGPQDESFGEVLANNALRKWQALFGTPLPEPPLFIADEDYMRRHKRTSKLYRFKETEVIIGHLVPFTLEGSPRLLSLLYHGGIGSRNALGFGLIGEVRNGRSRNPQRQHRTITLKSLNT